TAARLRPRSAPRRCRVVGAFRRQARGLIADDSAYGFRRIGAQRGNGSAKTFGSCMTTQGDTKSIQRRQILLVDDDVAFTSMLKEFLLSRDQPGWIVHTADNYAGALSCLKMHPVDLVVLDICLPVMDGLQFLTL